MSQIKKIFFFSLFSTNFVVNGQKNTIIYKLPPKVDSIILGYITSDKSFLKKNVFFGVLNVHNDTFTLSIPYFSKKDKIDGDETSVARKSNRKFLIGNEYLIPIVFEDYDNVLIEPDYVLTENGKTYHTISIGAHHSFFIEFTLSNQVVKFSYNGYDAK